MATKTIIVFGKVQGVFFRAHARDEADRLGITGQVCNLPDGSVHIIAEGETEAMDAFLAWCAKGPARARVDSVEVQDMEAVGYNDFSIVR